MLAKSGQRDTVLTMIQRDAMSPGKIQNSNLLIIEGWNNENIRAMVGHDVRLH